MARSREERVVDRFLEAVRTIEGAYSLVALTNKKLMGARDPWAFARWCSANSTDAIS